MAKKPPSGREERGGHPTSPNKPPSEKEVAAKQHEIAVRYGAHEARARELRPKKSIGHIRIQELKRLIRDRHGRDELPDTKAGGEFVRFALEHFAHMDNGDGLARNFASIYAPWLAESEFDRIWDCISVNPPRTDASEAGIRVDLTFEERERLRITTMFCIDKTREEVEANKKEKKRARDRDRQRRKRQPMIRETSRDSAVVLGRREAAILKRLDGDWTPASALVQTIASEPAFATAAPGSVRPLVHRAIERLQSFGKAEIAIEGGQGKKRRMLVRATKPL